MKFFRPHFYLSKAQRNALLLLFVLLLGVPYLKDFLPEAAQNTLDHKAMEKHQSTIDSLVRIQAPPVIYPFNPNFLTDYRAYLLGLPTASIDRLLNHKKSGKWLNNLEDFKKVAEIDDSLMAFVAPHLIFSQKKKYNVYKKKEVVKKDLNQADIAALKAVYGVGEKLSNRIVKYRKLLQGFSLMDQLYEVYGLDSTVVDEIRKKFEIKTLPNIKKIALDTISYSDLVRLPYLNSTDAQRIIRWRSTREEIEISELLNIEGFDSLKIDRINLYLSTL